MFKLREEGIRRVGWGRRGLQPIFPHFSFSQRRFSIEFRLTLRSHFGASRFDLPHAIDRRPERDLGGDERGRVRNEMPTGWGSGGVPLAVAANAQDGVREATG